MLVLVGPSASGKTEVSKLLINKYQMKKLITYTSRPIRINEVNDVDYHFLTKEEFEKRIKEQFFLEYVNYNDNYYGTSFEGLDHDKVVILEPQGLKHYLLHAKSLVKICFLKCDKAVRKKRMISRGDLEEDIKKRLINDEKVFLPELETIADWVVDSGKLTLDELTKMIHDLYEG